MAKTTAATARAKAEARPNTATTKQINAAGSADVVAEVVARLGNARGCPDIKTGEALLQDQVDG